MLNCAKCGLPSAVGQRFCGSCGTPLDAGLDVGKLIDERLAARLKDQKLVELETAQAVIARIGEWTKLFGYFVAIPLAILVVALTVLGVKQYSDLVRAVESSKQDLSKQLDAIKSEFAAAAVAGKTARAEGDKLNQEIAQIRKTVDLSQAEKIRSELEHLSARVTGIESRFKINSAGVSNTLERSLTAALARFADYMEAIGFNAKRAPATVTIANDVGLNSYYDPLGAKVMVGRELANVESEPSTVLWAYAQHLMTLENKAAFSSNSGPAAALVNAVPDYFVASHLNEPRIGRGFPAPPKATCGIWTISASSIRMSPSRTTWGRSGAACSGRCARPPARRSPIASCTPSGRGCGSEILETRPAFLRRDGWTRWHVASRMGSTRRWCEKLSRRGT
jgi:hypothetical protein